MSAWSRINPESLLAELPANQRAELERRQAVFLERWASAFPQRAASFREIGHSEDGHWIGFRLDVRGETVEIALPIVDATRFVVELQFAIAGGLDRLESGSDDAQGSG